VTPAGFFIERSAAHAAPGAPRAADGSAARRAPRILPYDAPATRDVLGASRGRRAALGDAAGVDTVRVLLIRVSFETDRLDALSSLSTGGDFELAPAGTALVDPAPHDRGYFESHLRGLSNYWRFQSCGRLEIAGVVVPASANESYRVSDLADYGPGRSGSWTRADIVRFFRDCVLAADRGLAAEGYPVRFGDYDAVIVAHAGSCLQTDAAGDTPNDVPSCFVALGPDEEISVDGGAAKVSDGCIVPETASQDGIIAGIAGLLAHEFGHQLGLPDLYDTRAGRTTAGYFDLMDSGIWVGACLDDGTGGLRYAMGFIPGGLSSWTRSVLGWTDFDTAAAGPRSLALPATGKCPARAARVEHAGDEYFVVENRAAELDGVPTGFVRETNGVVIGTGNCLNCGSGVPEDPVWELVNGYDLLLPTEHPPISPSSGPGVLVWRVNERLVAERFAANAINAERPLAVMLLEADGVADIGDPSSPYSYGWYADAYFAGGNAALGEETHPSSRSAWGVPSGAFVADVSARDTLMRCAGGVGGVTAAAEISGYENLLESGILRLPESGDLFLLHSAGDGVLLASGDTVVSIGRQAIGPPAWIEGFHGADEPGVVVGDRLGYIHAFKRDSWTGYEGWPAYIRTTLATHPVVVRRADGCRIAAAGRRSIHLVEGDGEEAAGSPISIFEREITSNLVVAENDEGHGTAVFFATSPVDIPMPASQSALLFKWNFYPAGGAEAFGLAPGYPRRLPIVSEDWNGGFWLAGGDLVPSEPGDEVFVVCRATGRILVYGDRGLLAERAGEGPVAHAPALGDLNGDSWIDLVYSDGYSIYAMNPSLANLTGWPRRIWSLGELPWESRFSTPVTIAGSGAGRAVVAGSAAGLLYVLAGDGSLGRGFPRKAAASFDRAIEIAPPGAGTAMAYVDGGAVRFRAPEIDPSYPQSWYTPWGNAGRTAWARGAAGGSGGDWTALAAGLVVYPNPSNGERVGFHFTAPAEGEARLEILTLTGELVLARTKRVRGGEDEFVVSMTGRASGVYISRLVVASGARRVEAVRKFAVVR
jgi:M6 family metalloprotease-like protein